MTAYNTGNPLGSAAAKDFFDNAQNLDSAVNDVVNTNWLDRFGRGRKTLYGIQKEAEQVILSLGYITIDSFEDGAQITLRNQVLRWEDNGEYYRWDGSLPKIVESGSTPENSGGIGLGAWVAMGDAIIRSQLSDPDGASKYPEIQMSRWRDEGDARGWGVKGDGVTDDSAALQLALNTGRDIHLQNGRYILTVGLVFPQGARLLGKGYDYWESFKTGKAWDKGTHLIFKGAGAKSQSISNLTNTKVAKTDSSGNVYSFTKFTQENSTGGSSATPLSFSCAIKLQKSSQLINLRVMINYNGIDGYNDESSDGLGDEWDFGVWAYDSNASIIGNVQVVGYWRKGAILLTENAGDYLEQGNPESTILYNVYAQGMRGLIIRNTPQIKVVSRDSATALTVKYMPSWTLDSTKSFSLQGSSQVYTYTGSVVDSANGNIQLTGISPNLPTTATSLRSPVQGNNWSGTVFDSSRFNTLNHMSGKSSFTLGLGQSIALEADGYPCRNLRFVGSKMQTVFDYGNSLFGDCRDWKFVASAFENGHMIAYDDSGDNQYSFTGNMRMDATTELNKSNVDLTLFTPRDCIIDYLERNTQFATNGLRSIKNWRANNIEIQFANENPGLRLVDSTSDLFLANGTGQQSLKSWGTNNKLDFYGNGITLYNIGSTVAMLNLFPTGNAAIPGVLTVAGVTSSGSIRPVTANSNTLGTATFPFSSGYTQTAMQVTSDRRQKTDEMEIDDAERRVGVRLRGLLKKYKLALSVQQKGHAARWHTGVIAQDLIDAFAAEGLDANDYAMLCHDQWDASEGITEEDGTVLESATEAGDRYTIRYDELYAFILCAM